MIKSLEEAKIGLEKSKRPSFVEMKAKLKDLTARDRVGSILFVSRLFLLFNAVSRIDLYAHDPQWRWWLNCYFKKYVHRCQNSFQLTNNVHRPFILVQLLYLLPIFGRAFCFGCYRRVFFTCALLLTYALYNAHGLPRFNTQVCPLRFFSWQG